jgi:ParB family chromosome partitioning protein
LEVALQGFAERPEIYNPADIARAGAFVSISNDGGLHIERGYVRREDEVAAEGEPGVVPTTPDGSPGTGSAARPTLITVGGIAGSPDAEAGDEDDGIKPLSERLVTELTAHRTLALRDALAGDPKIAFVAALHTFCLKAFYDSAVDSCLEIDARSAGFLHQAPGLGECDAAKAIEARHEAWGKRLPEDSTDLWDALLALDADSRAALFAHCAALTVNAVHDPYSRSPRRLAHADRVAEAVGLDMAAQWTPTVENYLGRVTKTRILDAVREAKGEAAAQLIDHLKKPEMAKEAERLLSGTGWLPEPLRLPEPEGPAEATGADVEEGLPAFLDDEEAPAAPIADAPIADAAE